MKGIIRLIGLCSLALASNLPLAADARNLYSIIVADTRDYYVGNSVTQDFEHMRQKMQDVAHYTDLTLKEITLTNYDASPTTVLKKLKEVQINHDDVVVFYYAGHGYRTESKGSSPWPNLAFSVSSRGLEYETIMSELSNKHPQFLLTLVDICNNVIPENFAPPVITSTLPRAAEDKNLIKNYRLLFSNTTGTIFIAAASVGEFSYGFEDGGLYTNAFLKSMNTEVKKKSGPANWQNILKNAYNIASDPKSEDIEHPYSEVNINELAG